MEGKTSKGKKDYEKAAGTTYRLLDTIGVPINDMDLHYRQRVYSENIKDGTHHDDCPIVRSKKASLAKSIENHVDKWDVVVHGASGGFIPYGWDEENFKDFTIESNPIRSHPRWRMQPSEELVTKDSQVYAVYETIREERSRLMAQVHEAVRHSIEEKPRLNGCPMSDYDDWGPKQSRLFLHHA